VDVTAAGPADTSSRTAHSRSSSFTIRHPRLRWQGGAKVLTFVRASALAGRPHADAREAGSGRSAPRVPATTDMSARATRDTSGGGGARLACLHGVVLHTVPTPPWYSERRIRDETRTNVKRAHFLFTGRASQVRCEFSQRWLPQSPFVKHLSRLGEEGSRGRDLASNNALAVVGRALHGCVQRCSHIVPRHDWRHHPSLQA
jgi:hypothetical protein